MRTTLLNTGTTIGTSILFTIVIYILAANLPAYLALAAASAGAPTLTASAFAHVPPTSALFAAFLGYNPMQSILNSLPASLTHGISPSVVANLTGKSFFPKAFAPAFMDALKVAIYLNATFAFGAAVASVVRGKRYVYGLQPEPEQQKAEPVQKAAQH